MREIVHKQGVTSFASLPGDSYAYHIDYEHEQGRVWLKSINTEREWHCGIDNRVAFPQDPVYRDQFTLEITLLELALHHDPRVHKTNTCKHVLLTRSDDDLVMQLSQRVYTRRNPSWGPPLQFTLEWVVGSGTLPHGLSHDPLPLPPLEEQPKPKVSREDQQRELIARLRDENKALKLSKRDRADDSRQYKTENDALRREVQQLKTTKDAQYVELLKLGSSHEFQRQHIEHLRRKIQGLQQQLVEQQTQLLSSSSSSSSSSSAAVGNALVAAASAAPSRSLLPAVVSMPASSPAVVTHSSQPQSEQEASGIAATRTADSSAALANKRQRVATD